MSFRTPSQRAIRFLPRKSLQQQCIHFRKPYNLHPLTTARTIFNDPPPPPRNPVDPITLHRLEAERRAHYKRRSYYLSAGVLFGMIGIFVTASLVPMDVRYQQNKLDSSKNHPDDPLVVLGRERKVIVQKLGQEPEERPDVVETGTTSVPTFPRVLDFADDPRLEQEGAGKLDENALVEYQLLGLGIRTVSFLGIQVYVVGLYVATDDIATLQQRLIRHITSTGTTLVAGEKDKLKDMLADPVKGLEIWDDILKNTGVRTCVRIVPTRNTDFHHLRDAWVRHVTAKAQSNRAEYGDEAFGVAIGEFKQLFNRGSVPKGKEILLNRDPKGLLAIWYDDGKNGAQRLGEVEDERIGRAVFLNYVAGKTVASEPARRNIIQGLMEFVERPVGTVATRIDLHV